MQSALVKPSFDDGPESLLHFLSAAPAAQLTGMAADLAAAAAFFSTAAALVWFVRHRINRRANGVFLLVSLLMLALGCGCALSLWHAQPPGHWLETALKLLIAAPSAALGVLIWPVVAKVAPLPGTDLLQREVERRERELTRRIEAEEALRHSQATLRELAAYQERIREDERKRIAREIHDELGQNLLALRLDIASLHARTGARQPRLRQRAATALAYIDTTMKSIRTIMNTLRPAVVDLGLPAAIEWQLGQFQRHSGIRCDLLADEASEAEPVPEEQAVAVFRILQESLNNIGRHSHASMVRAELRIAERRLHIVISDNGIGFYPGDRRKVRRFGLVGVEERVAALGGDLRIEGTPGRGTVVSLSVPLPPAPAVCRADLAGTQA